MENKAEDEITSQWRALEHAQHQAVLEETGQKRRRLRAAQDATSPMGDFTYSIDDISYTVDDLSEILQTGPGRPGRKGSKAAKPR